MHIRLRGAALGLVLAATGGGLAVAQQVPADIWPPKGDIPENFTPPTAARDYIKREVMIPMRDGVKLYTVIVIPKGATNAPRSEEHTSELQSLMRISYAVFCLKKTKKNKHRAIT